MAVVVKKLEKDKCSTDSFYINNRSSSAAMVAFSIIASCVGASATMGTIGLAFNVGTPAFWWLGSGALGLSVMTVFLARRVRNSEAFTLPQIVDNSMGKPASRLISIIIVVAWTSILAAQFTAITHIIQALTGLVPWLALLCGALLITAHTLFSGQSGIIKLDKIQCLIMLAGLALLALWLIKLNPGPLPAFKLELKNELFPVSRLIYFLLILGGSYVVCPMLFGRLLSARSDKTAQMGAFGGIIGLCAFSVLIVIIGLLAQGLLPAGYPPDQVLTGILSGTVPAWLSYLIYFTFLSVIISSADTCLLTAGLILAGDIWQKKEVKHAKLCVGAIALAGIALTFMDKGILGFLLMANDVYVCGVVAPVFIAIMIGEKRKARPKAIVAAISCGGLLGVLSAVSGIIWFSYAGIAVSALLAIISFTPLNSVIYSRTLSKNVTIK